jgi:hypothetical protein
LPATLPIDKSPFGHQQQRRLDFELSQPEGQTVVYRPTEILFASDVALGGLNGGMSQKELDLLQFSTSGMAPTGARPAKVMRGERLMPARFAQALTTYQTTFCVMPSPQTVPFLRIDLNSLPLTMGALAAHASSVFLTHAGMGTVRTRPALPTRSTIAQ